jgi:site-specific DNA-methyltransferase (adenine-specific)
MVGPYYVDGWVTIYHGDCRDVLPQLDFGAIVTDPPYGVNFAYTSRYADRAGADYEALIAWLAWHVNHTEWAFVTPGVANIWRWPAADWVLCWHKPGSTRRADLPQPIRPQGGFNEWEPILVYGRPRFMHDVYRLGAGPQPDTELHPCPKPLSLFRWLLGGAPAEDVILDPFMGSGTTLRAAKDLGRRAVGIEIEERYCEIAARRCAQEVLDLRSAGAA